MPYKMKYDLNFNLPIASDFSWRHVYGTTTWQGRPQSRDGLNYMYTVSYIKLWKNKIAHYYKSPPCKKQHREWTITVCGSELLFLYTEEQTELLFLYIEEQTELLFQYTEEQTELLFLYTEEQTELLFLYIEEQTELLFLYIEEQTELLFLYIKNRQSYCSCTLKNRKSYCSCILRNRKSDYYTPFLLLSGTLMKQDDFFTLKYIFPILSEWIFLDSAQYIKVIKAVWCNLMSGYIQCTPHHSFDKGYLNHCGYGFEVFLSNYGK